MDRYINADKLHYKRVGIVSGGEDGEPHCSSAIVVFAKEIDKAPPADVQEVKHGKWELYLERYYRCSVCLSSGYIRRSNFCPNCGAKMDLEEEENERNTIQG